MLGARLSYSQFHKLNVLRTNCHLFSWYPHQLLVNLFKPKWRSNTWRDIYRGVIFERPLTKTPYKEKKHLIQSM